MSTMSGSRERSWVSRAFVNGREDRLRAGWRLLVAVLVLVAVTVVFLVVAGAVVALFALGGISSAVSGLVGQVASEALVALVLVGVAWFVDRRTIPDLGLGGPDWWRNLAFGLVLGAVMTTAVFAVELAAGMVTVTDLFVTRAALGVGADVSFPVAFALTVLLFVTVGVAEEVMFRGYLMTNVAEGLNGLGPIDARGAIAIAAVGTSAVFGVVHITNPNATLVSALNITAVGVLFAATYVATDDLGVPIGVHITWNFSLGAIYGFPVSGLMTPASVLQIRQTGDPLVTGGGFGPEAGLVVYLAVAVAAGLTWWWVRRTRGPIGFPTDVAVPDLRKQSDGESTSEPRQSPQTAGGGVD